MIGWNDGSIGVSHSSRSIQVRMNSVYTGSHSSWLRLANNHTGTWCTFKWSNSKHTSTIEQNLEHPSQAKRIDCSDRVDLKRKFMCWAQSLQRARFQWVWCFAVDINCVSQTISAYYILTRMRSPRCAINCARTWSAITFATGSDLE